MAVLELTAAEWLSNTRIKFHSTDAAILPGLPRRFSVGWLGFSLFNLSVFYSNLFP
jgi:hypothetical protein